MDKVLDSPYFLPCYISSIVFLVGLMIGSFLNVVALRLLWDESFVLPRSKCPKCKTEIKWYDNIPVLSYIILKAKCRHCKEHISIQYPIVELFTGIMFLLVYLTWGLTFKSLFLIVLVCLLIVSTITDFKEQVIYDIVSYPLVPLGLLYNYFDIGNAGGSMLRIPLNGLGFTVNFQEAFVSALIGTIIGASIFTSLTFIFKHIIKEQEAFGLGDSILMAGLGAWFGWKLLLVILVLSLLVQFAVGLPCIVYNMYKDKDFKSLVYLGLLLFSAALPPLGTVLKITQNPFGALFVTLLAFGVAIKSILVIFERMKERQRFTVLPLGPAIVLAGFVVMFFGQQILSKYLSFI